MKLFFLILIILVPILWFLFSFRLTNVPPGINIDEANIGYNAVFLSKTLHDSHGRFLPVFILSLDNHDWHQPITVYATALFFKLFDKSFFTLRAVSVFFMILSTLLMAYLLYRIGNRRFALFGTLFFITTPILMIQSHLALENIAVLPFTIIWLLLLTLFQRNNKLYYLVLGGVTLGLGFYSYKGMRLIVPVWTVLTLGYILIHPNSVRQKIKFCALFLMGLFPFLAITPFLEMKYAGAVFDRQTPKIHDYVEFIYPYISSFDPSFLFIKGDSTPYHSTGRHGAMLLASLPFFLIGIYQAIKKKGWYAFIVICFFTTPILFGFANSVYRASRLLVLIPPFTILCALGAQTFMSFYIPRKKLLNWGVKGVFMMLSLLIFLNYYDFVSYYWFKYPAFVRDSFTDTDMSYRTLAQVAKDKNLQPVVDSDIFQGSADSKYFEQAYFTEPLVVWKNSTPLPQNSLILTNSEHLPNASKLNISLPHYFIQQTNFKR